MISNNLIFKPTFQNDLLTCVGVLGHKPDFDQNTLEYFS